MARSELPRCTSVARDIWPAPSSGRRHRYHRGKGQLSLSLELV